MRVVRRGWGCHGGTGVTPGCHGGGGSPIGPPAPPWRRRSDAWSITVRGVGRRLIVDPIKDKADVVKMQAHALRIFGRQQRISSVLLKNDFQQLAHHKPRYLLAIDLPRCVPLQRIPGSFLAVARCTAQDQIVDGIRTVATLRDDMFPLQGLERSAVRAAALVLNQLLVLAKDRRWCEAPILELLESQSNERPILLASTFSRSQRITILHRAIRNELGILVHDRFEHACKANWHQLAFGWFVPNWMKQHLPGRIPHRFARRGLFAMDRARRQPGKRLLILDSSAGVAMGRNEGVAAKQRAGSARHGLVKQSANRQAMKPSVPGSRSLASGLPISFPRPVHREQHCETLNGQLRQRSDLTSANGRSDPTAPLRAWLSIFQSGLSLCEE